MTLKDSSLTAPVLHVIRDKATEYPATGVYDKFDIPGTYLCRRCGLALYRASSKFHSGCGWPSFDEEIVGAVKRQIDADGSRAEIVCARCEGHLGHVFHGERMTAKDTRHCVNSASLDFVADQEVVDTEEAIFAAGCFWGVEYCFKKLPGVLKTEVGYSGGIKEDPSYEQVCRGDTGHYEAIRIVYDNKKLSYTDLVKYFFKMHDATQNNGQGPDIGHQYLSVIFYYDEQQKNSALAYIQELKNKNSNVATKVLPAAVFWLAEEYHQDYYGKNNGVPYCHF